MTGTYVATGTSAGSCSLATTSIRLSLRRFGNKPNRWASGHAIRMLTGTYTPTTNVHHTRSDTCSSRSWLPTSRIGSLTIRIAYDITPATASARSGANASTRPGRFVTSGSTNNASPSVESGNASDCQYRTDQRPIIRSPVVCTTSPNAIAATITNGLRMTANHRPRPGAASSHPIPMPAVNSNSRNGAHPVTSQNLN